jgi:hypothetical protein
MIWTELILRAEHQTFPENILRKIRLANQFLEDLMDEDGNVPRYGADDGAYLFPLSGSSHHDFRPVVNTAKVLFMGSRLPRGHGMRRPYC